MTVKQIDIAVLHYKNMLESGLYGIKEILNIANNFGDTYIHFNLTLLSISEIKACSRLFDAIIVLPAIGNNILEKIDKDLSSFIETHYKKGSIVASACSGTFILAKAGILKGKVVTIQNKIRDTFIEHFSDVILTGEKNSVTDGNIITSAGVMKWTYLTLEVINQFSYSDLTKELCQFYQIELESSSDFTFNPPFDHEDQPILKVQKILKDRYNQSIDFDQLASDLGMSRRTLQRRIQKNTGKTS